MHLDFGTVRRRKKRMRFEYLRIQILRRKNCTCSSARSSPPGTCPPRTPCTRCCCPQRTGPWHMMRNSRWGAYRPGPGIGRNHNQRKHFPCLQMLCLQHKNCTCSSARSSPPGTCPPHTLHAVLLSRAYWPLPHVVQLTLGCVPSWFWY